MHKSVLGVALVALLSGTALVSAQTSGGGGQPSTKEHQQGGGSAGNGSGMEKGAQHSQSGSETKGSSGARTQAQGSEQGGSSANKGGNAQQKGSAQNDRGMNNDRGANQGQKGTAQNQKQSDRDRNTAQSKDQGDHKKGKSAADQKGDHNKAADRNGKNDRNTADRDRDQNRNRADRGQDHNKGKAAADQNRDRNKSAERNGKNERNTAQDKNGDRDQARNRDNNGRERAEGGKEHGRVNLSQDQRTKIHERLSSHKEARISNVNFSINVGTRVPRSTHLVVLPSDIVSIVPQYRGYRYFVANDRICIVSPTSYEIVDVIETGGPSRGGPVTASLDLSQQQVAFILSHVQRDRARSNANFRLALGADVPREVELYQFDDQIVQEVPAIRTYRFVVVGDDVVIINPSNRDVVKVLNH